MPKAPITAGLLALVVAGAGSAAAETYPNAHSLRIQDFTGTVEIAVGGNAIEATLTKGAKTYPVDIAVESGVLVIAGEPRPRNFNAYHEIFGWTGKNDSETAFAEYLKDYPRLKITLPAGADVEMGRRSSSRRQAISRATSRLTAITSKRCSAT
jgi:hypothetical protein